MGRGRARAGVAGVVAAIALAGAGCGAESHSNDPRPQVPTRVSVTVTERAVTVSPRVIGVGPERNQRIPQNRDEPQPPIETDAPLDVVFVSANQTEGEAEVELSGPTSASSGTIFTGSPASFQVDLPAGTYVITAAGVPSARPAKLRVGSFRTSSENDVLLP